MISRVTKSTLIYIGFQFWIIYCLTFLQHKQKIPICSYQRKLIVGVCYCCLGNNCASNRSTRNGFVYLWNIFYKVESYHMDFSVCIAWTACHVSALHAIAVLFDVVTRDMQRRKHSTPKVVMRDSQAVRFYLLAFMFLETSIGKMV